MVGRRGRKRQLEVEASYWQLVQSGMGTVEACPKVEAGLLAGQPERGAPWGIGSASRSKAEHAPAGITIPSAFGVGSWWGTDRQARASALSRPDNVGTFR